MEYREFIDKARYTWGAIDDIMDRATTYYNNEDVIGPDAEVSWSREYNSPDGNFALYEFDFGDVESALVKRVQLDEQENGLDFLHFQVNEAEFQFDKKVKNLNRYITAAKSDVSREKGTDITG